MGTGQIELGTPQIELGTGEIEISPVPNSISPVPNLVLWYNEFKKVMSAPAERKQTHES